MVKRRKLISYTAFSTAIAVITGCFGGNSSNGQGQTVNVGTMADLKTKGQLKGNTPKGPVTVVPNGSGGQISAVNPTCTHNGCQVEWKKANSKFVCPCHGAEFAATGKVLKGPATKNLPTYPTQVSGNNVLVKA
ncbi:ubiquinol-cytochrome c reductase iron-sulfur subunit [Synechocystis salina LEGE 06155]|nr:ubiquinol-cytochrome c reductase iron-sulfur subunit [Synechocystis salina LEGE 06155]